MKLTELYKEIVASLHVSQDEAYRKKLSALVPTESRVMGVPVPRIRELVKEFHAKHKDETTIEVACELLDLFSQARGREEMLFGIFLLARLRPQPSTSLWQRVDRWVETVNNWEVCDQLAMNIAGPLVAKDMSLVQELVNWTKSKNFWRRRFAVAATTVLNRKGQSYPEETFLVCEPLLLDKEPMVRKAVAWAIREVARHDENAVLRFLERNPNGHKHFRRGGRLSGTESN